MLRLLIRSRPSFFAGNRQDLLIPINNSCLFIQHISFFLIPVTVPITDASFFTQGFAPSPSTASTPFLPTLPFELVKNWNSGALAFSQVSTSNNVN
jgi:hypothetical protein